VPRNQILEYCAPRQPEASDPALAFRLWLFTAVAAWVGLLPICGFILLCLGNYEGRDDPQVVKWDIGREVRLIVLSIAVIPVALSLIALLQWRKRHRLHAANATAKKSSSQ
jgi:hypothetical protein